MRHLGMVILFLSVVSNVAAQIFVCRHEEQKRLLNSWYAGVICGFLFLTASELFAYYSGLLEGGLFFFPADLVLYFCFSYCYFHFINMGETARRIRLLRELYDSPGGLTEEDILSRYDPDEVVNIRLSRLLDKDQIVLRDGRYYPGNPAMFFIARTIMFLEVIIFGKKPDRER